MEKFTTRLTIAIMALMVMMSITHQAKAGSKVDGTEQSDYYGSHMMEHKKWAEIYHGGISDKERYENNVEEIVGHDVEFKPKKIPFPGITFKMSMASKYSNGGMALIKGAEDFAYNGKEFYAITVDASKCRFSHGFSDCKQDSGASRVEFITKEYTWNEGTDRWVNYAILPAKNILFNNGSRRFTVGQCHPLYGDNITWMIKWKDGRLVLSHNFKSFQDKDGNWRKGSAWPSDTILKYMKDDVNELNGKNEWTNIRINFKNSKNPDGKLHIWLDDELVYDYNGPTNWSSYKGHKRDRNICKMKFGLYTSANLKSAKPETREDMVVFVDYMAFAKTEKKLEKLLKKDK